MPPRRCRGCARPWPRRTPGAPAPSPLSWPPPYGRAPPRSGARPPRWRAGRRSASAGELVAETVDGDDEPRIGRPVFDLLPELRDVHVDGARQGRGVVVPDGVEELLPRHDLPAVLDEVPQEPHLARRQIERLPLPAGLPLPEVDRHGAELVGLETDGPARGAAQHRLDAGHQLQEAE